VNNEYQDVLAEMQNQLFSCNRIIIINEYPEAGLMASISVQHIYCRHELQQELH